MLSDFQKLFDGLNMNGEIRAEFKQNENIVEITLYNFPITAAYLEAQGMVMLHASLCEIPRDKERAREMYYTLLAANNCFEKTASCTFGLDRDSELITLQTVWLMNRLTPENFVNLLKNFVSQCAYWIENIQSAVNSDRNARSDIAPFPDFNSNMFIRV